MTAPDAPRTRVQVVRSTVEMQARALGWRAAGKKIAFVPTMGYLHAGHVSLLEEARRRGDIVVLSIFVNPTQFGPKEDLSRYPRDEAGDLAKAEAAGTDVAFAPEAAEMYPPGYQTYVEVGPLAEGLCGASRPGHFRGVATVVLKLLELVQPHVALFGAKDYQQLQVIRRLVRDFHVPTEIVGMPIIREPDGLAMSSRNAYLLGDDRTRALVLSRALGAASAAYAAGERRAGALRDAAARRLAEAASAGDLRLDYLELRDADTLASLASEEILTQPALLAVAAFVGAAPRPTRLIDNVVLGG